MYHDQRALHRLHNANEYKKHHELKTPEGVELSFNIANKGQRFAALLLDQFLIVLIMIAIFFGVISLFALSFTLRIALLYFLFFMVRNFYYMVFEIMLNGLTPAKKLMKMRVVTIEGGNLQLSAVIIRNITREVEVMFPLMLLFMPADLRDSGMLGAITWIGYIWIGLVGTVIFINKENRRMGDLIAGTIVIDAPQKLSLYHIDNIVNEQQEKAPAHIFSQEHLQHYGEFELQKLEYILRNPKILNDAYKLNEIATSIRIKIFWNNTFESDLTFLQDFYKAQRQYLENHMLFGKRKSSKFDTMEVKNG